MKLASRVLTTMLIFMTGDAFAKAPSQELWKEAFNTLETITQRARSLGSVSAIPASPEEPVHSNKRLFGVSGDKLRSQKTLNIAIEHLLLNDNQRALDVAEVGYHNTGESNPEESGAFLRVIYEALRKLERYQEASAHCIRFVSRGSPEPLLLLSCSHTLYKASERSLQGNVTLTRPTLNAFAYSQSVRTMKNHAIQSSLLIANAYENIGQKTEAHDYLQRAIAGADSSDGWLSRAKYKVAIQELENGQREKSQKSLLDIASDESSDKLTRLMAKHSLARALTQSGQYDAADQLYKEAIAISEKLPAEETSQSEPVGVTNFSNPNKINSSFPAPMREKLLSEYAAHLCARGRFEECDSIAEKLPASTPAQSHSELLLRSGVFRKKSQSRVATILGSSQTDLAFLREQQKIKEPLNPEDLARRLQALTLLADSYGTETAHIKRILEIHKRTQEALQSNFSLRANLTRSLSWWLQADSNSLNARLVESQKELSNLAQSLLDVANSLVPQSYSHWNSQSGGISEAQQHNAALLARAHALFDSISSLNENVQRREQTLDRQGLSALATSTVSQSFNNHASLGALQFLNALSHSQKHKTQIQQIAKDAFRISSAQSELLWEIHLESLRFKSSKALRTKIHRLEATLTELSDLHARHYRSPQNSAEQESLKQVRKAWRTLLAAVRELESVEDSLRSEEEMNRTQLISKVIAIRKDLDSNDAQTKSLLDALRAEMQTALINAANDLYLPARNFRDRLRIAIADTDLFALENTEAGQEKLGRAAEERRRWIDSLRQTTEWELGR